MEHVILDVDLAMGAPGSDIDDGFALALALADPEITVDLVTTVNGNTDVATATALTMELLRRMGRPDVPVHRGAQRPLLRPQERFGVLPPGVDERQPLPAPAAVAMIDRVMTHPGETTLVAVGPLTNVALAMRLNPFFAQSLKRLIIMGGVFDHHTHQTAMPGEFNVWSDPEAAQIVLTSGIAAWWVGLDVTLQVRLTREQAVEMQASTNEFESFAGRHTVSWIDHLGTRCARAKDSCPIHDPLAVAAVTQSDILAWSEAYVQVETGDRLRGVMLAEYGEVGGATNDETTGPPTNAHVARAVDVQRFTEHFLTRIKEMA